MTHSHKVAGDRTRDTHRSRGLRRASALALLVAVLASLAASAAGAQAATRAQGEHRTAHAKSATHRRC